MISSVLTTESSEQIFFYLRCFINETNSVRAKGGGENLSVVSIVLMAIGYIISTFMLGISSGIALSMYYLQNNLSESDDDCDENSYNSPKEITAKKTFVFALVSNILLAFLMIVFLVLFSVVNS